MNYRNDGSRIVGDYDMGHYVGLMRLSASGERMDYWECSPIVPIVIHKVYNGTKSVTMQEAMYPMKCLHTNEMTTMPNIIRVEEIHDPVVYDRVKKGIESEHVEIRNLREEIRRDYFRRNPPSPINPGPRQTVPAPSLYDNMF